MTKVAVVLSNPSHRSGGPALKKLYEWLDHLGLQIVSLCNVSIHRTPNNRPLKKSEYQIKRLCTELSNYDRIVTCGNTAMDAVNRLGFKHFNLPHPSPLNRKLNKPRFVLEQLEACYEYIYHGQVSNQISKAS